MFNDDALDNGLSATRCTICTGYVDDDGVCRSTSDLYPCSVLCPCGRNRVSCHAVPVDESMERVCDECAGEIVRERAVEAMIAASPAGVAMDAVEASRLAVEAALGVGNLLNGRDPAEEGIMLADETEDETKEIEPETNAELVYGVKGAAA